MRSSAQSATRPARGRWLAVLAAAGVLVMGACASEDQPALPAGFSQGEAGVLSVAYPDDWVPGPEPDLSLSMQAPDQTAFLSVLGGVADNGDPDLLEILMTAGPMMHAVDYQQAASVVITVSGAQDGRRVDYTYADFAGGGGDGRGVDVGIIAEDRSVHIVRLTWLSGSLSDETANVILNSITVA